MCPMDTATEENRMTTTSIYMEAIIAEAQGFGVDVEAERCGSPDGSSDLLALSRIVAMLRSLLPSERAAVVSRVNAGFEA